MFNLAPLYYRKTINPQVGPIVRLATRELTNERSGWRWEALAYLHPDLTNGPKVCSIYGVCDGTGTGPSQAVASHKAISEALERWAWMTLSREKATATYGLDLDPTTTGFAAWPGPFVKQSRRRAYFEAAERWALVSWWAEVIGHEAIDHPRWSALLLKFPDPQVKVVIIYGRSPSGDYIYGFAAASSIHEAAERAEVELRRNLVVLARRTELDLSTNSNTEKSLNEKRLLFFASDPGHQLFLSRVQRKCSKENNFTPRLIVDAKLPGPWGQYSTVWRCLFEPIVERTRRLGEFIF